MNFSDVRLFGFAALAATLGSCGGGGGGSPAAAPTQVYTLSGKISVPADTMVDRDVNDISTDPVSNDEPAAAQEIPNPVTVGGYANAPRAGQPGQSYDDGDVSDFYRVELGAGQVVSLLIATPGAGDLDLYLWDETGTSILAESVGTGSFENLNVAEAGIRLIEVVAYEGASNYVLAVGQNVVAADADPLSSEHDIVSGEAVLRLAPAKTAAAADSINALETYGVARQAGEPHREMRVSLSMPGTAELAIQGRPDGERRRAAFRRPEDLAKWSTLLAIKALRGAPGVAHAEPNFIRRLSLVPNDEYYGLQWHYPQINLPLAWDITTGSNAVTVAVVDSGIVRLHPEFQGRLAPGFDFISNAAVSGDGDGVDPNPADPGYADGLSLFHGTHVAGTIAAAGNNADGLAGIGWGLRLMPLRALNESGGTSYDIRQALRYAAGLDNDSGTTPAQPADVINLSFGGAPFSSLDQQTIDEVRQRGIVLVAAAGNEATSAPLYPAAYDGVLSVSASSIRKTLAGYSNFGATIDLAAPGGDYGDYDGDGWQDGVWSTCGDDSSGTIVPVYCVALGTSMASPHVAGVVALMKSVNAALTPDDVDALLTTGNMTEDIGAAGPDERFGHGLIDARKAVEAAATGQIPLPEPAIYVSPESLSFGSFTTLLNIYVRSSGAPGVEILDTSVSDAWLRVRPTAAVVDGFGQYAVSVTRGSLAPGSYSGYVEFVSSANTIRVPVLMDISADSRSGDAGLHYVLLVDVASEEVIAQREVTAADGVYAYRFTGVVPGSYQIFAGSDANNDGFICDPGEACGAYLTLDQPLAVDVEDANQAALNFSSGFDIAIHSTGLAAGQRLLARRPVSKVASR
jgi:serine protease